MSNATSIRDLTDDYVIETNRRNLRLCAWLGLSPAHSMRVDDTTPDEHGVVEISWRSTIIEMPVHGKTIAQGASGVAEEPPIFSGTVVLYPTDAVVMLEVVGPKPEFPMPVDDQAMLEGMREAWRLA